MPPPWWQSPLLEQLELAASSQLVGREHVSLTLANATALDLSVDARLGRHAAILVARDVLQAVRQLAYEKLFSARAYELLVGSIEESSTTSIRDGIWWRA